MGLAFVRLGVTLLERNSRGVTLTGAGQVLLLDEGRIILDQTAAAARRSRRAASSPNRRTAAPRPPRTA